MTSATKHSIAVDGVTVQFGGVTALSDVSIAFGAGRGIDALIGPNGAGKTTLFNVFTGVVQPTRGRIFAHGEDVSGMRQDQIFRRGVSRTFQGVRLFGHLTARQNVTLAARSATGSEDRAAGRYSAPWWESAASRDRARAAMDRVGLASAVQDRLPSQLSLWDSRMVEIARAISSQPGVLMLDEPAAGLNTVEKTRLRDLLLKLSSALDCHIVVVEHDMELVMSVAEHVWVLNFGKLLAHGTPAQVQADPLVLEAYLGSPEEEAA
ncbi:MAG: ABC transporter ATP-binding protein [Pseudomonadota bacterium]